MAHKVQIIIRVAFKEASLNITYSLKKNAVFISFSQSTLIGAHLITQNNISRISFIYFLPLMDSKIHTLMFSPYSLYLASGNLIFLTYFIFDLDFWSCLNSTCLLWSVDGRFVGRQQSNVK